MSNTAFHAARYTSTNIMIMTIRMRSLTTYLTSRLTAATVLGIFNSAVTLCNVLFTEKQLKLLVRNNFLVSKSINLVVIRLD